MDYGYDLVSNKEMFTPHEDHFVSKIFLSLGSPGGNLILNQNVIILFVLRNEKRYFFCFD